MSNAGVKRSGQGIEMALDNEDPRVEEIEA